MHTHIAIALLTAALLLQCVQAFDLSCSCVTSYFRVGFENFFATAVLFSRLLPFSGVHQFELHFWRSLSRWIIEFQAFCFLPFMFGVSSMFLMRQFARSYPSTSRNIYYFLLPAPAYLLPFSDPTILSMACLPIQASLSGFLTFGHEAMRRAGTGVWVFYNFFFLLVRVRQERMRGTSNQILLLLRWQRAYTSPYSFPFFSHVAVSNRFTYDLLPSILGRTVGLFGRLFYLFFMSF